MSDLEQNNVSLSDEELLRYSRQILLENWDIDAQLRLKSSRVVILGAGGLGCPVSETLARSGVGSIHIVDDDVIEASNLQRQTLFTADDIGNFKAETAYKALKNINPFVRVTFSTERVISGSSERIISGSTEQANIGDAEKILQLANIKGSDNVLLLDCTDNFAARELLNKISVTHKIPLLSASAIGMTGQLALYEPSKHSGCYHCVFGDEVLETVNSPSEDDTQTCSNSGVLASTTTIMGNLQANAALQYLGRGINPLEGELLLWNGTNMTQQKIRYRQDSHCPICRTESLSC